MSFLTKDKQVSLRPLQVRNIKFENQDAEYYTVGWMAFCKFLGRVSMLDQKTLNDRPLRLLTTRMSNSSVDNFEVFIKDIVLRDIDDPEKNSLKHLMGKLSMQYYESNMNHRFRGTQHDLGDWARTPKYRINQKMLDAFWLNSSNQEEAILASKNNNLYRHNDNINELVNYYLKTSNFSLIQDSLYAELDRVHKDLEYYVGHFDPDPSLGKYDRY